MLKCQSLLLHWDNTLSCCASFLCSVELWLFHIKRASFLLRFGFGQFHNELCIVSAFSSFIYYTLNSATFLLLAFLNFTCNCILLLLENLTRPTMFSFDLLGVTAAAMQMLDEVRNSCPAGKKRLDHNRDKKRYDRMVGRTISLHAAGWNFRSCDR